MAYVLWLVLAVSEVFSSPEPDWRLLYLLDHCGRSPEACVFDEGD
jgi:hypothetical protein